MVPTLRKPLASLLEPKATRPSRQLLSAPAPIPLGRLYPLEVLMELRDQAARNVAMYTRQAQQLTNPTPVKTPLANPAVEEPETRRRAPTLIGY